MARARISKSHQLQFSFIGNLNIWVHQFQYFLQVAEGGNKQFRAPGTTSSVCPFVPFVLSAEQATLKAKDEHWSLCRDGKDLLFTPYFCHPLLFLCPRSEYGSDFPNPCPVICGDTGYTAWGSKHDPTMGLWLLPSNSIHCCAGRVLSLPLLQEQMLIFFTCDSTNWIIGADLTINARITKSQEFSGWHNASLRWWTKLLACCLQPH